MRPVRLVTYDSLGTTQAEENKKRARSSGTSQDRLEIGPHHIFDPAYSGVFEEFAEVQSVSRLVEFQRLEDDVYSDLVAEFEAVDQGFFRVVYFDERSIEQVLFDAASYASCENLCALTGG